MTEDSHIVMEISNGVFIIQEVNTPYRKIVFPPDQRMVFTDKTLPDCIKYSIAKNGLLRMIRNYSSPVYVVISGLQAEALVRGIPPL